MALKNGSLQSSRTSWIPRDNDIPALRAELSRFHVTEETDAKGFEKLKASIIGFTEITVGRLELQAVLVAPKKEGEAPLACLISNASEACICEIPALVGVNLKKRVQLEDDARKPKYIYKIGIFALNALKAAANRESKPSQNIQSLVPPSNDSVDPSVGIVSSRLQMTMVLSSSDPAFSDQELRVLASELKCVLSFQDPSKRSYYYFVVGEDEREIYRLYMGNLPEDVSVLDPKDYRSVTLLNYNGRDMLLCREV